MAIEALVVGRVGEAVGIGFAKHIAFGLGFVGIEAAAGGDDEGEERRNEYGGKNTAHDEAP
jgi:hypothetical protein